MSEPDGAEPGAAGRVLLFMNEVAGGRKLLQSARSRFEAGSTVFFVAAPQNQPQVGELIDESGARAAAQSRIDVTIAVLREFGIEAQGMVFDPNPLLAIDDAIRNFDPDEIVLSCLPSVRSGVLRRDLVASVRGRYDIPVEHISVQIEDDSVSWDVTHTLVVASQTVDSPDLLSALRDKIADSPHRFTIVCPLTGESPDDRRDLSERLARTLAAMYREDVAALGQPVDADPYAAVENAVHHYSVDEILVSTLEGSKSKWLEEGLIDRVNELTNKPVAHITASRRQPGDEPALAGASSSGEES